MERLMTWIVKAQMRDLAERILKTAMSVWGSMGSLYMTLKMCFPKPD